MSSIKNKQVTENFLVAEFYRMIYGFDIRVVIKAILEIYKDLLFY